VAQEAGCSSSPVHQPGEKGFVDWAGATIPVQRSGYRRSLASLAVRDGAGQEFLHLAPKPPGTTVDRLDQRAHHAFEYFSGVPDSWSGNLRTGVSRAAATIRMSTPLPRVCDALRRGSCAGAPPSSKDKARSKSAASCRTLDPCRPTHQKFFSVGGSEPCDRELLERLNQRPFRKKPRRITCQCIRSG